MLSARLEDQLHLPTHWAYSDAWEYNVELGKWIDNRQEGFQVWSSLARAVYASSGVECDGCYGMNEGYYYLIIVDHDEWEDGAGEWFAVPCESVKKAWYIEIEKVLSWCYAKMQEDIESGYDMYEEDPDSWFEDSEEEIEAYVKANMILFNPIFVDTIPLSDYDLVA